MGDWDTSTALSNTAQSAMSGATSTSLMHAIASAVKNLFPSHNFPQEAAAIGQYMRHMLNVKAAGAVGSAVGYTAGTLLSHLHPAINEYQLRSDGETLGEIIGAGTTAKDVAQQLLREAAHSEQLFPLYLAGPLVDQWAGTNFNEVMVHGLPGLSSRTNPGLSYGGLKWGRPLLEKFLTYR